MSNVKMLCPENNFSAQVLKVSDELTAEMSKRNLTCQCINFIMQDNANHVQRHTLELPHPTNNFKDFANLLVAVLSNYKGNHTPRSMCLQVSKLRLGA